jgi:hypothetical protein
MRRVPLLGSLVVVMACSTLTPPEVIVHIDADSMSRARARQLHVLIVNQDGETRLDRSASLFGDPPEVTLPTTVPVVPRNGDVGGTFSVFAQLVDQDSVAFNKKVATLSFTAETLVDVDLFFSDLCIGIDCPTGQTCTDGACVQVSPPPHMPGTGTLGCFNDLSLTAHEQDLIDLPADTWLEVPNTHFADTCKLHEPMGAHAVGGCSQIINAWGGGAWDPNHSKMIVWGGGSTNYWGNEVYAFSARTFAWELLVPGSPVASAESIAEPMADGKPASRATYDGLSFLTESNRLFAFGGAISSSGGAALTWELDVEKKTWAQVDPGHTLPADVNGQVWMGSAYDEAGHRVFMRNESGVYVYDIVADAWTRLIDAGYPPLYPNWSLDAYRRGIFDSKRKLFFTMGGKTGDGKPDFFAWDTVTNKPVYDAWVTTGGDDVASAGSPGADYDSAADAIVAWSGGAARVLDPTTKHWSTKSAVGAPPLPVTQGTYGRFRYVSRYNVFVLVNRWDQNVYFYKHTTGCGR